MSEDRPYYDGLLDQKDGKWTEHWSVLKDGWLYFFKDRTMQQVVSSVLINSHTAVKVGKTKSPNSFQFLVKGDGPQLRLRCSTTQQRTCWMEEIGRCASFTNRPKQVQGRRSSTPSQLPQRTGQLPQPPVASAGTGCSVVRRSSSEAAPTPARPASVQAMAATGSQHQQQQQPQHRMSLGHVRHHSSGDQLPDLPKKPAAPPPLPGEGASDLMAYDWFFGTMSRERSEDIIKMTSKVGRFIIRQSESSTNSFSLSFRDEDRIRHYLIAQQGTGRYALAGLENMSFRSIPELVQYYMEVNDGWAKPMSRAACMVEAVGSSKRPAGPPPSAAGSVPNPPSSSRPTGMSVRAGHPTATPAEVFGGGGGTRTTPTSSGAAPSGRPLVRASTIDAPPAARQPAPSAAVAPAPPPPASKRPVLKRGASDLDMGRVRLAQQQLHMDTEQQNPTPKHTRSVSVNTGRPGGARHGAPEPAPGRPGNGHVAQFQDARRQQLFPDSGGGRPNPGIPERSAVSLGQQKLQQQRTSYQNVHSQDADGSLDQEDYISTEDITPGNGYVNHQLVDEAEVNESVMHDYLDLQDCLPSPPCSPSPTSSLSPTPGGAAAGLGGMPRGGSYKGGVPPPPNGPPPGPGCPLPARPPKPGGNGRSSPLYDAVA